MNYKAIEILKTFSDNDIKSFRKFLNSPFFNTSKNINTLYEALIKFHSEFSSKFLNEEKLYKKIFPNLKFNKSSVKNLFADLSELLEKYLAVINFQNRELEKNDYIRDELFKRNLGKFLDKNFDKSESLLNEYSICDSMYFLNLMKLLTDKINHSLINKPRANANYISDNIALHEKRSRSITYYFVKEMIREYDNLLTFNKTFYIDKDKNFTFLLSKEIDFSSLLKFIVKHSEDDISASLFEVYEAMFKAYSEPDKEEYYLLYKKLLLKNISKFSPDEIRFLTSRMIRYCMNKCAEEVSRKKFERELFEVYNFILINGYYKNSVTDYFPIELFRIILLHSIKLKKFKWALAFINEYKSKLHPERRVNIYNYSCAVYYFHLGKFRQAMQSFHKIQLNHFMMKIDLKNLMLMTYFELGLDENVFSLIDTYKHFLANDKTLSETEINKNKNFINSIQKLTEFKNSKDPELKFELTNNLKKDQPGKDWIMEKINLADVKYTKSA